MNPYQKFNEKLSEYGDLGAQDSEPRAKAREMIRNAFKGKKWIPEGAMGWEIFSNKSGSDSAAEDISNAARKLVDHILNVPSKNIEKEKEMASSVFYIENWETWDDTWY